MPKPIIAQRMRIKGMFGPKSRELQQRLSGIHEILIRKIKHGKHIDPYPYLLPTLSSITSKYAIMSVGNLPKPIRIRVAKLLFERERVALISKPFVQIKKIKDINAAVRIMEKARKKEFKIEQRLHALIKDPKKSAELISNYDSLIGNITLEGSEIWQEMVKKELRKGKLES